MNPDVVFWVVLIAFTVALQLAALRLRKHFDPSPIPSRPLRRFLTGAWIATWTVILGLDYVAGVFDLTWPVVVALLPFSALTLWYWAKYQVGILPTSTHYLPRCAHCGQRNPADLTRCQWCHEPLEP